nr:MAG TPA: hypothetical protein [Herelleviridae sp.]
MKKNHVDYVLLCTYYTLYLILDFILTQTLNICKY